MKKIGHFISLLFLIILIVFVVQNLQDVELNFLGWNWTMTLAAPVLGAYVLGSFTGRSIWRLLNSQRRQRKIDRKALSAAQRSLQEKQVQEAQSQVRPS